MRSFHLIQLLKYQDFVNFSIKSNKTHRVEHEKLYGMNLAPVDKEFDEQSITEILKNARKNVKLIEDHDERTSQQYKVLYKLCSVPCFEIFSKFKYCCNVQVSLNPHGHRFL